jgi:hypothetical protein
VFQAVFLYISVFQDIFFEIIYCNH